MKIDNEQKSIYACKWRSIIDFSTKNKEWALDRPPDLFVVLSVSRRIKCREREREHKARRSRREVYANKRWSYLTEWTRSRQCIQRDKERTILDKSIEHGRKKISTLSLSSSQVYTSFSPHAHSFYLQEKKDIITSLLHPYVPLVCLCNTIKREV